MNMNVHKTIILESLIKDNSKLTFDCAKATISRDERIEIKDDLYWNPEIQNAINMGLVKLNGPVPPLPDENLPGNTRVKLRNVSESRIAFDCIQDSAGPNQLILVPVNKLGEPEVQNAINMGLIKPEEELPDITSPSNEGPKKRLLINTSENVLALECIKRFVAPNMTVEVPEDKIDEKEIQNALAWGILLDPLNPPPPVEKGVAEEDNVDEVKVMVDETGPTEPKPRQAAKTAKRTKSRPKAKAEPQAIKAKPIVSRADSDEDILTPSKIIDKPAKRRANPGVAANAESQIIDSAPPSEDAEPRKAQDKKSRFDLLDIYDA